MASDRSLPEILRSRAWEDRQHRKLREQAADHIEALEKLAYAETSAGPMLWKDIWQLEVDQMEWYRSGLNPIWEEVRASERSAALEEAAKALENAAPIEETPKRLIPFHDSMGELIGEFVEPAGHKWKYLSGKEAAAIVRSLIPERKASDDLKEAEGVGR